MIRPNIRLSILSTLAVVLGGPAKVEPAKEKTDGIDVPFSGTRFCNSIGAAPDIWGQSGACKQMRLKNVRAGRVAHYRPRRNPR